MSEPDWYKDAVIYELRVRSFYDSDGDGVGDLRGLIAKLDYLKDLGVSAIWMLPLYPSPLRDDGYDIADYLSVHPSIGNMDDFRELIRQAHARDLKIITELVLNHTSDAHPWFQRARRAPAGSADRNFYVWSDDPKRWSTARVIFQDFETSNWTWDPIAKSYYWHRFFSHQPDLNFENPVVVQALTEVLDFWFSLGVDGMRLDAVPYLHERDGTTCENLPETHDVLKKLRAHVDAKFEGRMLLAEANQWPEDAVAYFGRGDECHMAFHFPIMPRLFMALRMEDSYPIIDILEQTPAIPENCQWALFLRNHDELTLEMVTDEERDYMVERYAADRQTRINLGIRRRLAPLLENDRRAIELMSLLLLSLPGTPVIYYGDEIGMGDNPYLGDRDGVRTPMQWSADRNGGFSRANPQRLILPPIIDPEYRYDSVNVEVQDGNPSSLLWWTRRMLALRKRHRAFGRGSLEMLAPENRKVLAFLRRHQGEVLLIVVNLSRFPQWVELELSEFTGITPVELAGNTVFPAIEARPYRLTLGSHDGFWLSLSTELSRQRASSTPSGVQGALLLYTGTREALFAAGSPLEAVLASYVPGQRWFRSKSRSVLRARLVDVFDISRAPATAESSPVWLAFVELEFNEGARETYALPLRLVEQATPPEGALLKWSIFGEEAPLRYLYDASRSPETGAALSALAFSGERLRGSAHSLRSVPTLARQEFGVEAVRPLGREQSNTSFVFGQQLVGKLVRKVEVGESLEVETLEALTKAEVRANVPALAARIDIESPAGGGTLFVSELFLPNEGDAWQLAIDHAQRYYEQVLAAGRDRSPPPPINVLSGDPATAVDVNFVPLAALLGRRTAELHRALFVSFTSPALAPRPFTSLSSRGYYQAVRNLSAKAFDALKSAALPDEAAPLAAELIAKRGALRKILDRTLEEPLAGEMMRVHGDYHLGQVLYSGTDFHIIDFEGEPARSPAERRRLRSPLFDIAGMVRSLHYAALGVLEMPLPGAQIRQDDRPLLTPWARHFFEASSAAFVRAYLAEAGSASFLPRTPAQLRSAFTLHLAEKALYEVLYELDNRPAWVGLPLRGLLNLIDQES